MDSVVPISKTQKFKSKYLNTDVKHRFLSIFNTVKEGFKILMASMLLLFVPQNCGSTQCDFNEKFTVKSWSLFVLAFNFLTLLMLIGVYIAENIREFKLIKYFDKDESKPDNNLVSILGNHKDLAQRLYSWNKRVMITYIFAMTIFINNAILSGIIIYKDYYLDIQTITVYITNILLIFGKLYNGLLVSKNSVSKKMAYSLTLVEPISWNILDTDM